MPHRTRGHLGGKRAVEMRRSGGPATCRPARHVPHLRRPSGEAASSTHTATSRSVSYAEPVNEHAGAARLASVLLGMAVGMAVAGLTIRLQGSFAGNGLRAEFIGRTVVGIALLSLALGVRVPQQLAWWVCIQAWRRFLAWWVCIQAWRRFLRRGRMSGPADVVANATRGEKPLYWLVLSVVALGGGAAIALLPSSSRVMLAFYDQMHASFLWSPGSLAILQAVATFAIEVVPLAILGLAFSGVHHLVCPYGRWDPRTACWLLIGAACGTAVATWVAPAARQGNLLMVTSALPALLVALVCASSMASRNAGTRGEDGSTAALLPVWTDKWSGLVLFGSVFVGGGAAFATALWVQQLDQSGIVSKVSLPIALVAIAVGIAGGCHTRRTSLRSIGGFGMACVAAGTILTVGSLAFRHGAALPHECALALAFSTLVGMGFAAAYGQQALLNRVANRSLAGAGILTQTLICSALLVWFGEPVAEHLTGGLLAFVLLVLCLLGLGGVLIIYEPNYSLRSRRIRLCAVFACISAIIAILGPSPLHTSQATPRPVASEQETSDCETTRNHGQHTAVADIQMSK